jgi:crotonobetainyl-CoA:carnitine CoA-transferase CaiB-like acyl-CoA transferase
MTVSARHLPARALRGIRVLDFSHVIAGPFATFHLAQMGAEVVKVERPFGGDVMRHGASGERGFTAFNAGKQFRTIDLSTDAGRSEAFALASTVDVVVDNYRPGVLQRHGLGYEAVKAVNPKVIYCAISGYGALDPARSDRGAYDHVIQALTGMTMLAGAEGDPPIKTGFPVVDAATGIVGALAVVAALRERDLSGAGCFVDVSMWACALQLMYSFACETMSTDQEIPRVGNKGFSGSPAADTLPCRDGWLALGANTPRQVRQLMAVLDVPPSQYQHLLEPDPTVTSAFARARDPAAFHALLKQRLSTLSAADLEQRLNAAGVPAARVRTLREFTREAVDTGWLEPVVLGEGPARAMSPGLGWRTLP